MPQVNILLVDGSTLFRQGLKQLLPSDFTVAGEARDFREALDVLRQGVKPDLILVDCPAPAIQEALAELNRAAASARIVYLADAADLGRLRAALEGNAAGYITKDRSPEALVQQLRLVLMGEKVFPADLAQQLVMGGGPREVFESHKGLSQRENQILRCLLEGQSNKMIALKLNITEATVKVHLKSLLRKINASNRTQAAIWAMNNGISAMEAAA